jgi:hypothetical protein
MESYLDDIYLDDIGDVMKYIYVICADDRRSRPSRDPPRPEEGFG